MRSTLFNVTASTRIAKISRDTHYRWLKEDEKYRLSLFDMKEEMLDFAEMQLFKAMQKGGKGSTRAAIFFLKTRGKERGYSTYTEDYQPTQPKNEFEEMTDEELIEFTKDLLD